MSLEESVIISNQKRRIEELEAENVRLKEDNRVLKMALEGNREEMRYWGLEAAKFKGELDEARQQIARLTADLENATELRHRDRKSLDLVSRDCGRLITESMRLNKELDAARRALNSRTKSRTGEK